MSTQVMPPPNGHIHDADNILPSTDTTKDIINKAAASESISKTNALDTPLRDDNIETGAAGMSDIENEKNTNNNNKSEKQKEMETSTTTKKQKNDITKHSSLKSANNPLTIARHEKIKEGQPLIVKFDERVVVHTVPYWDPCGETFYDTDDDDQGPRG